MTEYQDVRYLSHDNLKLYARDFSHPNPKATILCMPGLTRNAADFDFICKYLSSDYRLLAVDQRGRGFSAWDTNTDNYNPAVYVRDMFTLLDTLELPRVILLGTSLGGLMAMLMATSRPERIDALIINDIGPEISAEGMARIQTYVGKLKAVTSWEEAIAQTRQLNAKEFSDLDEAGWKTLTQGLYHEDSSGKPVLAYDPEIAPKVEPGKKITELPNLWPQFESIENKPILLIRGATSDILAPACVAKMQAIKPDMQYCELANRGHAPLLNEPKSIQAIDSFLRSL